jgi:hypothetical protein
MLRILTGAFEPRGKVELSLFVVGFQKSGEEHSLILRA